MPGEPTFIDRYAVLDIDTHADLDTIRQAWSDVQQSHRPWPAAALIEPHVLDALQEERAILRKVLRGLRELEQNRLVDDADVWAAAEHAVRGESKRREDSLD